MVESRESWLITAENHLVCLAWPKSSNEENIGRLYKEFLEEIKDQNNVGKALGYMVKLVNFYKEYRYGTEGVGDKYRTLTNPTYKDSSFEKR